MLRDPTQASLVYLPIGILSVGYVSGLEYFMRTEAQGRDLGKRSVCSMERKELHTWDNGCMYQNGAVCARARIYVLAINAWPWEALFSRHPLCMGGLMPA